MSVKRAITNQGRNGYRGERIKRIRENLGLSQVDFGNMITMKQNTDKNDVKDWEEGSTLPNRKRLELIAKVGQTTIEELMYGSLKEYIYGIILNDDALISNDVTSSDLTLLEYLEFNQNDGWVHVFKKMDDEAQNRIAHDTYQSVVNKHLSYKDTQEISDSFLQTIELSSENNTATILSSVQKNLATIDTDFIPERLESMGEGSQYSPDAINEIQTAINQLFNSELDRINQKKTDDTEEESESSL